MTSNDPDLIEFELVSTPSANNLLLDLFLVTKIVKILIILNITTNIKKYTFCKMMGVANVNGVISDMDKARVSAEVISQQTLVRLRL